MRKSISTTLLLLSCTPFPILNGCRSGSSPDEVRTQFVQAVAAHDLTQMQTLLGQPDGYKAIRLGENYDTPESHKNPTLRVETILMWAIRTGHFKSVLPLVGNSPAVKNNFGRTPLMYAAMYGPEVGPDRGVVMAVLQSRDPQLAAVDKNGDSALFLAIRRGAPDATGWLLRAGAPISRGKSWLRNKQKQSALDLALASKNSGTIALVIQQAGKYGLPLKTH